MPVRFQLPGHRRDSRRLSSSAADRAKRLASLTYTSRTPLSSSRSSIAAKLRVGFDPELATFLGRIGTGEQVAQRSTPTQRQPNPPAMLRPVMEQVTSLAESPDVAMPPPTMRRVMVEMCRRQHHLGRPDRGAVGQGRRGDLAASTVPPGLLGFIPPPAIAEVTHGLAMRPATDLAATFGADEADPMADLRPVDRVEASAAPA